MPVIAGIKRLMDAGATRLRMARAAMLVAAMLLSVAAWGASTARADVPLKWAAPVVVDPDSAAERISCPTASLCVAGDDAGNVVTSTNPTGGANAWHVSPIAPPPNLVDTSCITAGDLCVVVDSAGTIWNSTEPTVPGSWGDETDFGVLGGVSCVPSTDLLCVVAEGSEMLYSADPTVVGDEDWNESGVDSVSDAVIDAVSCPSTTLCVAVDNAGDVVTTTEPENADVGWTTTNVDSDQLQLENVSCASASFCAAVDNGGQVLTSTDPTGGAAAWTATDIDDVNKLTGISCPSTSLCVAVDEVGNVMMSTNPTGGAGAWTRELLDSGTTRLAGVSCSSNQECVIIDDQSVNDVADAIVGEPIPLVVAGAATGVTPTGATVNGTVNPNARIVRSCEFQWGLTTSYGQNTPCAQTVGSGTSAVAVSAALSPLTPNTTYHYRIVATNGNGDASGTDGMFTTLPEAPAATTGVASGVSQTGATLEGTVSPNGANVSSCQFQWGLTTSYGQNTPCAQTVGSGTSAVAVSAALTGLTPNTTYHYGVMAGSIDGSSFGGDQTFTTPAVSLLGGLQIEPSLSTLTITKSDFTAQFSATVNPGDLPTQAHYEYGLDPKYYGGGPITYDQSTPVQTLAPSSTPQSFVVPVSGLVPNALYHVRLVATNSAGTVDGPDQTFTTAPAPGPPPPTLGQTANLTPISGIVLVKLPYGASLPLGRRAALSGIPTKGLGFIPITQARQVPMGSVIDSARGTLDLVVSNGRPHHTQKAHLKGGVYTIGQTAKGLHKGLTTFTLKENAFKGAPTYKSCTSKKSAHAAAEPFSKRPKLSSLVLQTLRASDNHGRFRTRGRYSAATVRGTDWDVQDRCDGTLTLVHRGTVDVLDFATRKTIALHAGQRFLARAVAARSHKRKK